jgi:hypothetical protein
VGLRARRDGSMVRLGGGGPGTQAGQIWCSVFLLTIEFIIFYFLQITGIEVYLWLSGGNSRISRKGSQSLSWGLTWSTGLDKLHSYAINNFFLCLAKPLCSQRLPVLVKYFPSFSIIRFSVVTPFYYPPL